MAPSGRIGDTVSHLVHRTDFVQNRTNSRALEPYGVTMYQAMSLIYVAEHEAQGTVNQRALERYTQLTNPGVTKLVTALEKQGLLSRTQDPEDARSHALHTTPLGRERCRIFRQVIAEADRALTRSLTAEEITQLKALLKKLHAENS